MSLHTAGAAFEDLIGREWLLTNRLGGYAGGTPLGINTRKYHGLLVAALSPPVRRMVLLSRLDETIHCGAQAHSLSAAEYPDTIHPNGYQSLVAFDHEPFPRWAYQGDGWTLEKNLRLLPDRNAVCISYTLLGSGPSAELQVRPLFALRGIHQLMLQWNGPLDAIQLFPGHHRIEATTRTPEVYFAHDGAFGAQPLWYLNNIYRRERERGYAGLEDLWSPGLVRWHLQPGRSVHFACAADPIDLALMVSSLERASTLVVMGRASEEKAADPVAAALVRCAEQFVPVTTADAGATRAIVVTQYPWTPPSGRDALISLSGLFLVTRRFTEARTLLESFAADLWNGLMPSVFPEDAGAPRYEGADVSLWFVHAVQQFLKHTGEDPAAHGLLVETVAKIVEAYQHGTTLGIGTDPDGLLFSHAAAQPTTWMDAKVGDWIITPRQGRAVEINALWYNALCVGSELMRAMGNLSRSEDLAMLAASVRHAFNRRFWNERAGCCYDVVHDYGVDAAIRPNQLLAVSLPHPVLDGERHASVLNVVRDQLLTPFGLRTLAPAEPGYAGRYEGDPVSRDRAYHQGSVYPWLLGAFADATLRVHGHTPGVREEIRTHLQGCIDRLTGDGLGQLCELFDGDVPRRPGGAIADARSLAEVLRAYVQGVLGVEPGAHPGTAIIGGGAWRGSASINAK
jgi:predicted glycogen debranching enzyme